MVRDRRLRQTHGLGEVADAHLAGAALDDHREQLHPRRVAERREDLREAVGGAVVHRLAGGAAGACAGVDGERQCVHDSHSA